MAILRVALDVPLPRLFDYAAADASPSDVGRRVAVPFGRRTLVGVIIEVAGESALAPEKLRPAGPIFDDMPALPAEWLAVAQFASEYYQRPLGEVIHAALPTRLRRPLPATPRAGGLCADRRGSRRSAAGAGEGEASRARPPRGRSAARVGASAGRPARARPRRARCSRRGPDPAPRFVEEHALTPAQAAAVGGITAAAPGYQAFLLAGVTGSGKTEVYLHCIARALANHRQALVLVPEINLTPQMRDEFARRFPGVRVVTLTSAVAANERAEAWLAAQSGAAQIVLGTRLAVFARCRRSGWWLSTRSRTLPSSSRRACVTRGATSPCTARTRPASRSSSVRRRRRSRAGRTRVAGRYRLLELKARARPGSRLPDVRLVDSRVDPAVEGLSAALTDALAARLARHEQSLVFLNRRGYAPVLACAACGWIGGCTRCAAHLVLHTADRRLRCHHCGLEAAIPRHCPVCGNVDLAPFGRGTQRIEETLAARFPAARVLRIDSDSTRAKGRWDAMRGAVHRGDADILVGTQILAKGHDFPRVTLVGVLNADAALAAADYRAPERLFAQLYQVAGRAGRAAAPGEVLVQTRYPDHPLYQALVRHEFAPFAEALAAERRQAGFPPFVHEAVLRADSARLRDALGFLERAVAAAPTERDDLTVFDPVPMSLARLAGRERAQVLVQSPSRRALQGFLAAWSQALYAMRTGEVRWHLDVDPIEF